VAEEPPPEPQAARVKTRARGRIAQETERKERVRMPKTTDKVSEAAASVKPYFERAMHDAELRDNVRNAYESARAIYEELIGNRGVTGAAKRVATDKDIQDELRSAVSELRTAADRVRGKDEHKSHPGLLLLGLVLALVFNPFTGPQIRKWISEKVFGESDGFTYQGGGNGSSG
jgi:hypothetical protein